MFSHLSPFYPFSPSRSFFLPLSPPLSAYLSIHPSVRLSSISSLYFTSKSVGNGVVYISNALPTRHPSSPKRRAQTASPASRSLFPAIRKRVLPAKEASSPPQFVSSSSLSVVSEVFPEFQRQPGTFQTVPRWLEEWRETVVPWCLLNDDGGSLSIFFLSVLFLFTLSLSLSLSVCVSVSRLSLKIAACGDDDVAAGLALRNNGGTVL